MSVLRQLLSRFRRREPGEPCRECTEKDRRIRDLEHWVTWQEGEINLMRRAPAEPVPL